MNLGDTCTTIYGFPYATGASNPCNIGSTECLFDTAVQVELDRLATIVNRTAATIPMVKVALTAPTAFDSSSAASNLVFDTVLADTDNMFASSAPDQLTVNTPGIYGAFAFLYSTSVGAAVQSGSTLRVSLAGFFGDFLFDNLVYASGTPVYQSASGTWPVSTVGQAVILNYSPFIQTTDIVTVQRVEMGLFWLGDLP